MKVYHASDISDLTKVAQRILSATPETSIFLIYGELGAGKTTLVRAIAEAAGSADAISSPTFSIIQEYRSDYGPIAHIDLYRLANADEAWQTGIGDYLFGHHLCFVEWPQLIEDFVGQHHKIKIDILNDGLRKIVIS